MRILLVEPDDRAYDAIAEALHDDGYHPLRVKSGDFALTALASDRFDAAVVGSDLEGESPLSICQAMVATGLAVPVVVILDDGDAATVLAALEAGCTDYIVRPVDTDALRSRLRAAIRSSGGPAAVIRIGETTLESTSRTVSVDGRRAALSPHEYELLEFLARRRGLVHDRKTIMRLVWPEGDGPSHTQEIDAMVTSLRRRLGRAVIEVRPGEGYLVPEERASTS